MSSIPVSFVGGLIALVALLPGQTAESKVSEAGQLIASDAGINQGFGSAIAIEGDVVAVGAPGVIHDGRRAGAVYLFVKPTGGWGENQVESARLEGSESFAAGFSPLSFGRFIAMSGDTIVVGDPNIYRTPDQRSEPRAYVFVKPPSGWTGTINETATLRAWGGHGGSSPSSFGGPVAIDGDTVVIGGNNVDDGVVYVFQKPAGGWSGTVHEQVRLHGRSGGPFGEGIGLNAVAVHGRTVVASATGFSLDGIHAAGAAYVFEKPLTGWHGDVAPTARLTTSNPQQLLLGWSVAVAGDTVFASHPTFNQGSPDVSPGTAHAFVRPPSGWQDTLTPSATFVVPSPPRQFGGFGSAVAAAGNKLIVFGDQQRQGEAFNILFRFERPPLGWSGTMTPVGRLYPADPADRILDSVFFSIATSGRTTVLGDPDHGKAFVFDQ